MAPLDEAARQYYLAQAGIQLWYARAPLPGAAPSPDFDFSEPEVVQSQPVADMAVSGELKAAERADRLARIQGLMAGENEAAKAPAPVISEPAGDSSSVVVKPALEQVTEAPLAEGESESPAVASRQLALDVHWGFWVGSRVMLVSTISDDASYQLQEALARNILKAMNQTEVSGFRVQWPVFNNLLVPGNDRGGFNRVVADQCREYLDRELVLLGVLPGQSGEEREALLKALPGKHFVDFEASLAALSTDPNAKRTLWEHLKSYPGLVR